MDNHREHIKKDLNQSPPLSEFDKEAKEGWDKIGMEHWDEIHHKLDHFVDQEALGLPKNETNTITIPKDNSRKFSFKMSVAAMLLIALGLSITFVLNQPDDNVQLYESYYKPLNAPEDNFRSGENNEENNEKAISASDAYDDLEYKKAIAFYTELLNESPKNSKYTLFLGLSYMNDGKYDEAINLYNLHASSDTPYDEDIIWYLALAHLRKGEIQTSKLLLQNIAQDSKNYYAPTADELANKLSKIK